MEKWIKAKDLALRLGVSFKTLHQWRLAANKHQPWYLPASVDPEDNRTRVYSSTDIASFMKRNPKYRNRIIALNLDELITAIKEQQIHEPQ